MQNEFAVHQAFSAETSIVNAEWKKRAEGTLHTGIEGWKMQSLARVELKDFTSGIILSANSNLSAEGLYFFYS